MLCITYKTKSGTGGAHKSLQTFADSQCHFLYLSVSLLHFSRGYFAMHQLFHLVGARLNRYALVLILFLAVVIRLLATPLGGYGHDLNINKEWGHSARVFGLVQSYKEQMNGNMLPNYPPLSLVIFTAAEYGRLWMRHGTAEAVPEGTLYIKLPGIIADVLTCLVFFLGFQGIIGRRKSLVLSLIYALHPAVIYNSAVWGQTDSVFTFFAMAALVTLPLKRGPIWAGILLALGILSKPHAIIFIPLLAFVLLPRPLKLLQYIVAGITTLLVAFIPITLLGSGQELMKVYTHAVGFYPALSSSAYNFWWSLYSHESGKIMDTELFFGVIKYRLFGYILFGIMYAAILALFRKKLWAIAQEKRELVTLFMVGALIAYSFFLFNTEMHERYLFAYMILALPLVLFGRNGILLYGVSSLANLMNLLGNLPLGRIDIAIYKNFFHFAVVIACAHLWAFVLTWMLVYGKTMSVSIKPKTKTRVPASVPVSTPSKL